MRPIRVLSLFDGMSCGQIALRDLGIPIEAYYASEIDKFAIQQTQLNFPDTVQLGDVRNIDVDRLCDEVGEFDLLLAGSPCFAAGTKVLTSEGYKNIEDVRIGDYVLTHQNRYRKVLKIGGKEAMTYKLRASGFVDTVCTANHPFYARKKQSIAYIQPNGKKSYKIQAGEPEWIEAQHLGKQYYVAHNIEQQESSNPLNITEEEAWVIGRYIADGHTRKDLRYDYQKDGSRGHNGSRAWQLILSIGNNKVEQVKSHFKDLHYSCYPHGDGVHRFVFSNKRLVQIVEAECGCGAINKHFGEHLIRLPRHLLEIVLQSYLEGDGYLQNNGRYSITTISRMLPITIQRVISKLYGRHINVTYHVPKEYRELCGRIVHQMPQYTIKFSIHPSKGVEKSKRIGDKMWRNIKAFEPVGEQKVFNLEVEDDNSYTANNLIVHNCQSFSFAGKRVGMKTKENMEILTLDQYLDLKDADFEFEGQSYLFWEFMRVLTALRRRNPNIIFLLENVEMGKKWESVLSEAIGIRGVHINSALVSAQNRKRIYWSNIRVREEGLFGYRYTDIPQPDDRGILLRDILEKEVDEKYYLKDEVVQKLLEHKQRHKEAGHGFGEVFHDTSGKMGAIKVGGKGFDDLVKIEANSHLLKNITDTDGKANAFLATSHKGAWANGMTLIRKPIQLNDSIESGGREPYQQNRVYDENGIAPACMANLSCGSYAVYHNYRIRRITPTECARLQTIPSWYRWEYVKKYIDINLCEPNVELTAAKDILQTKRPDYVICTILGSSEQVQLMKDQKLINQKNAQWTVAIDNVPHISDYASCTIKGLRGMEQQTLSHFSLNMKRYVLYVENLSMEEMGLQKDCAQNIIAVLKYTEIQVRLIRGTKSGEIILGFMDTCQDATEWQSTGEFLKITLAGDSIEENVFTISILIKQIIELRTYIFSILKANTKKLMLNFLLSQLSASSVALLSLRMGIIESTSETQQYRMLGNGWTVEVIKHIFSFIKIEEKL